MPLASAEVDPTGEPSIYTVTALLDSAVPEMRGVELLVKLPLAGVVTTGAAGAVVSTIQV